MDKTENFATEHALGQKIETTRISKTWRFSFSFQEVAHHLQKELKAYVHCIKDLCQASKSLQSVLQETYESDWTEEANFKSHLQASELLWTDFLQNVQDSAMVPLHTYLMSFPVLKNKIAKRGRKMVDYDNARHHLETLQAAKKKDELKIQKAQDDLKEAKKIYEDLNNELHVELPDFYNSRVSFYAELFTGLFGAEYTFHTELGKSNGSLGDISQQLGKDYASYIYQPKRPLSKSLSTNSENGFNGDASGVSSPSSPGFATMPSAVSSPVSSTSAASIKGEPSQPTYTNDTTSETGTLAYYPRRKAPVAPRQLQRIDEEERSVGCRAVARDCTSCSSVRSSQEASIASPGDSETETSKVAKSFASPDSKCYSVRGKFQHFLEDSASESKDNLAAGVSTLQAEKPATVGCVGKDNETEEMIVSHSSCRTLQEQESVGARSRNEVSQVISRSSPCGNSRPDNMPVCGRQDWHEDASCATEPSSLSQGCGDETDRVKGAVEDISWQLRNSQDQDKKGSGLTQSLDPLKRPANIIKRKFSPLNKDQGADDEVDSISGAHNSEQIQPARSCTGSSRPQPRGCAPLANQDPKDDTRFVLSGTVRVDGYANIENKEPGMSSRECSDAESYAFYPSDESSCQVRQSYNEDRNCAPPWSKSQYHNESFLNSGTALEESASLISTTKNLEQKFFGESFNVEEEKFLSIRRLEKSPVSVEHCGGNDQKVTRTNESSKHSVGSSKIENKFPSSLVLHSPLDDIESRPLLYDDECSEMEDKDAKNEYLGPRFGKVNDCKVGLDLRPELDTGQRVCSDTDNSKYYRVTFMDVSSSLEDDWEDDAATGSQTSEKFRGQSIVSLKSSQARHSHRQEVGSNKSLTAFPESLDTFGHEKRQIKPANREDGSSCLSFFNKKRPENDMDQMSDVLISHFNMKGEANSNFETSEPDTVITNCHAMKKSGNHDEIFFEDVPNPWIDDSMLDDYHTVTVITEEIQEPQPVPDKNKMTYTYEPRPKSSRCQLVKSPDMLEGEGSSVAAERIWDYEFMNTPPELVKKCEKPFLKLPVDLEIISEIIPTEPCRMEADKTNKTAVAKCNNHTPSEVPEHERIINTCEVRALNAPSESINEESIAEDDVLYAEALAYNEWTLRSFVRMLMPKTLQLLALHTKSYIDSCLHSDKPQEKDLAEIRRICKDALTKQTGMCHLPCTEGGSSVDVTLTVTPEDLGDEGALDTGNISHSDHQLCSATLHSATIVPSGNMSAEENLPSLAEDSTSVDGDYKSLCQDDELGSPKLVAKTVHLAVSCELDMARQDSVQNRGVKNVSRLGEGLAQNLQQVPKSEDFSPSHGLSSSPMQLSVLALSESSNALSLKHTPSVPPPSLSPDPQSPPPQYTTPQFLPPESLPSPSQHLPDVCLNLSTVATPPPPPPPPPLPPHFQSLTKCNLSLASKAAGSHFPNHTSSGGPIASDNLASASPAKQENKGIESCEDAVEILDKHFHSILKEIIAKGSSSLKKSRQAPGQITPTSGMGSLHDTILSRLQASVPVIDCPVIDRPVAQANRPISKTSVLSAGETCSWSSPKDSRDALVKTSTRTCNVLDDNSRYKYIQDSPKSTTTENIEEQGASKLFDSQNNIGRGSSSPPRASKPFLHGNLKHVSLSKDSASPSCSDKYQGAAECPTSEQKQHVREEKARKSGPGGHSAQDLTLVREDSLMRQLERSLASRRAAFSQHGSEDNLTVPSSPEDSDHCSHASSDPMLFDRSRQTRGSNCCRQFSLPDFLVEMRGDCGYLPLEVQGSKSGHLSMHEYSDLNLLPDTVCDIFKHEEITDHCSVTPQVRKENLSHLSGSDDFSPTLDNGRSYDCGKNARPRGKLVLSPTLTVDVWEDNSSREKPVQHQEDGSSPHLQKSSSLVTRPRLVPQSKNLHSPTQMVVNVSVFMRNDIPLQNAGRSSNKEELLSCGPNGIKELGVCRSFSRETLKVESCIPGPHRRSETESVSDAVELLEDFQDGKEPQCCHCDSPKSLSVGNFVLEPLKASESATNSGGKYIKASSLSQNIEMKCHFEA
ncbi:Myc box-dependent-interacting protein 1-like [Elysia marginata]|uniref:Myc box-dependent-interacting protein 1-like n=1 Tax=Elysia marginata TaxID=1093978 RepID=A0AAV4HN28_9GAST|nr:Myc box-dependent-interacting protein 1-like [Elysia marginata]